MTNWVKKNWFVCLLGIALVVLVYMRIDSAVATFAFKKKIKEKDTKISELWGKIGDSKKREAKWEKSSGENWDLAMEKEAKLRRKDKEMIVRIHKERALKKKIKEMPLTQVIVRTIEIINCPDIVQQEQGIVFTLDCGKDNLTILESTFSLKKEVVDWTNKFNTSQGEVSDLKNVIIAKDGAYVERGVQLGKKDGIIKEWTDKFNLSEKRGKTKWRKGFKKGVTIGGIGSGILFFFLRK